MRQLLRLSMSDFSILLRDPSLRIFLVLPVAIFLVLNYLLPYLVGRFPAVENYVPYIVIVATIESVQMFGFIYSMVLIDEKETGVAKVYGILPVANSAFVVLRMIIPMLLTVVITWALLMLQPFYQLSPLSVLFFAFLAGLIIPVYVIGIVNMCNNRMEGVVWIKVFNVLVIIPAAAFFVPAPWQHVFGILPSHWAFQGLYSIIELKVYYWQLLIGFLYLALLTRLFANQFTKKHFI